MRLRPTLFTLLVGVALLLAGTPPAQAKSLDGMREGALGWIEARSLAGAGAFAPLFTEAVEANGLATASWPAANPLRGQVTVPGPDAATIQLLRPLRALALAGDPRAALEGDLVGRVLASFDGAQFGSPQALNDDAYAILALTQAGLATTDSRLAASARTLAAAQREDGGWGWAVGSPSGTDMTGLVLMALDAVAELEEGRLQAGLAFVSSTGKGAGYAETPRGTPNCESTAWALRAQALGGQKDDPASWRMLVGLQQSDGGFAHLPGGASDPFCTAEVLTAVALAEAGTLRFSLGEGRSIVAPGLAWALLGLGAAAVATRRN